MMELPLRSAVKEIMMYHGSQVWFGMSKRPRKWIVAIGVRNGTCIHHLTALPFGCYDDGVVASHRC